ncbi:toll-like receptor 4 [Strongylocentrotus purpuratus]|uniref:TIR domain-containing protein n=1 Tax=Strongylocentrotus purpuratus TaxID=7668 RepID=A0A7M7P752_STRPU|nr:toll-like receptor 4 [Strongylocentrotus purpuratus]
MTWKTIFQLSILLLCSLILVSPRQEFRPHNEHGIRTIAGHFSGTRKSFACNVDIPEKMADCSDKQLKDVPSNLINDLRSLDLSSNLIRSLWNTSFLRYSLLEKLNLANNLIGLIDLATFFPVDQLTSLILDFNPIFTLPGSDMFQESKRLSSLSLQFCNLSYFPNETLGFLPQLQSLSLRGNELTYINISECPKRTLTTLDFRFNTFQEISADVLNVPCKTEMLTLGGNNYKKIDADVVADYPIRALEFGYLGPGQGQTFEVWKSLFTGIAQSEIDRLLLVKAFNDVPRDFFDPLRGKRLSYLRLGQNEFKFYPSIFANLTSVYEMVLEIFHIGVLEPAFFDGMKELRSLTASVTWIEQVNPSGSSWKIDLRELDLSENSLGRLSCLSPFAFKGLTNLTSLDLAGNAESQWLIKMLRGAIDVQNGKETTCSSSSLKPFGGEALESIQPNDLCTTNCLVYFSTVSIVVIVVIVIVIVYHYRWQLRYKLFLLRLAILGYREILDENDREEYDFDIYVISTEDDENWIQDQLKPYFQGLPYYKRSRNVFTDDDLPIGMHRTEAVDRVLTKSFKIIVLVSKAACADDWFMTCFRMAMDQVADTQTENILLVFLENIEEDEMPFYVRLYMRGQGPYVKWMEDDDEGQKYFWKRLEKCLSVNRKRNHLIPAE